MGGLPRVLVLLSMLAACTANEIPRPVVTKKVDFSQLFPESAIAAKRSDQSRQNSEQTTIWLNSHVAKVEPANEHILSAFDPKAQSCTVEISDRWLEAVDVSSGLPLYVKAYTRWFRSESEILQVTNEARVECPERDERVCGGKQNLEIRVIFVSTRLSSEQLHQVERSGLACTPSSGRARSTRPA
jgi:hypothetical protein